MQINSTEFLGLIARNNLYVALERAAPAPRPKKELIFLAARDGRAISMSTPSGFVSCPVEIPRLMFDDFIEARLLEQEVAGDSSGRIIYRLTAEGFERGTEPTAEDSGTNGFF